MAAETVVIDIVTNFRDSLGSGFEAEKRQLDNIDKSAEKVEKSIEKLMQQTRKFGSDRATAHLDIEDKATSKLTKAGNLIKSLGNKTFSFGLKLVDKATAPIRAIKNNIFSLKTLIAGIASGVAIKKAILDPIGLADAYSGAKIGFSTLLGEAGGQKLMDQLDQFAKATPFKTSNTISQAQRMIAMGWDPTNIVADMTTIGDAAAATGKGDEGLQRIVTALAQIKSKGKLSTEELNQLAEAGISAKRYIAEGLGYGSGDAGLMAMSADLQKGAIGAEAGIQAIMNGMKEYQGMMDQTANETVEGLKSQIEDTFEINIFRRWGQGLQEGAKKGLGSIVELLDASEDSLSNLGDQLEKIGSQLSGAAANTLKNTVDTIMEVADSAEFKDEDLFGKVSIMWDKVIAEPFGTWWDSKGQRFFSEKMSGFGRGLGSGASNIIKGILGFNDDAADIAGEAATIGGSFAKGFISGFDGAGIWKELKESLVNAFKDALKIISGGADGSSYASAAILGYFGLKGGKALFGGANGLLGLLGKPSIGSSIMNAGANAAIGLGAGELAGGASISAGALSALGLGSIAGGAAGVGAIVSGIFDLWRSGNVQSEAEKDLYKKSAAKKGFGVAGGAMIGATLGSVVPGVGTAAGAVIGSGVGGVSGWLASKKALDNYSKSLEEAQNNTASIAEVTEDLKSHFGSLSLSMKEIATLSEKILGGNAESISTFTTAAAEADTSFSNLQTSYQNMGKIGWKAGLGFGLSDDEKENYKASINTYMESAKQYIEDKQYEFTASVSLLTKDGSGKDLIAGGNDFYSALQKDLNDYGGKLEKEVDIALKDGKIEADEQKIISDYQAKIKEITDKLSGAETEAKMEALKIKFNGANMDSDSFQSLQQELSAMVKDRTATYDDALEIGITNLKLQFPEGGADYDAALKELTDSYNAQIDELSVQVQGFQFDALTDAYGAELEQALADSGFAGTTQEKISQALQQAMTEGVDVVNWDIETCKRILGLEGMQESSIGAIAEITSSIAGTMPERLDAALQSSLNVDKFSGAGNKAVTSASSAIKTAFDGASVSASIGVNVIPSLYLTKTSFTVSASGGATGSSTGNLSISSHASGGYVNGKQLSWLAEEGYGEYVIPTDPKRRGRALSLWEKAGETLGVARHASGGVTGSMLPSGNGTSTSDSGTDKNIEVNVGGITIQLGGNDGNIINQIGSNKKKITSMIAEMLNEALEEAFESLPLSAG